MALEKEIKVPGIGGMDLDIIDMLLKPNDTRIVRNGRRADSNDKLGTITNIKGNAEVTGAITLPADPKVVGSCEDSENDAIIYFVSGSDKSGIYRYFYKTNHVQEIYSNTILNFSTTRRVFADVIDGLLYFVSGDNEPRKLNLEKAYKFSNNIAGGYTAINKQVIDAIKYPPLFPPENTYSTNNTIKQNNLRDKLFQFRYSYVYDDKEISKTSPVSRVALPEEDTSWDGEILGDLKKNNVLQVKLLSGPEIVEKIKLYVREGNNGLWALVEVIDKAAKNINDDTLYVYNYFNNRSEFVENQVEIERLYDRVPLFTDTQEYLHINNLIYGGNTEWYPDETIDVTLTAVPSVIDNILPGAEVFELPFTEIGPPTNEIFYEIDHVPTLGNVITVSITYDDITQEETYLVDGIWSGSVNLFASQLFIVIQNDFARIEADIPEGPGGEDANHLYINHETNKVIVVSIIEYENSEETYSKFSGFKSGSSHLFGIVYYDRANRSNNVSKSDDTRIYLPFTTESPQPFTDTKWRYGIKWEINHIPPDWATHYQWLYAKNQDILSWTQYLVKSVVAENADNKKIVIDLDYLNTISKQTNSYDNYFPNTIIKPYVFNKGDRIRFITTAKSDFTIPGLGSLVTTYIDLEILGPELDGNDDPTNKILAQYISPGANAIGVNSLVEIYTPKKQVDENIFYEFGQVYDIIDPGTADRRHAGSVNQTFDPDIPASGSLSRGDSYSIPRAFVIDLNSAGDPPESPFVESQSFSDFNELEVFNYGRPNIVNEDVITEKRKSLLLSGKFFQDTDINELSSFDGLQSSRVSDKFGDITIIEEKGDTLKVYQGHKVNSFYIGKVGLKQADIAAGEILAISDKIIGPNNPSKKNFGCLDQFSAITVLRNTYFYDHTNQCICRDDPNGVDNISDAYSLNTEVKRIANILDQECATRLVCGGYDPESKEVLMSFTGKYHSKDGYFSTTLAFREDINRFTTAWEWRNTEGYGPEFYSNMGNVLISFMRGGLWKHNVNSLYNNFFGIQRDITIDMVFNINPEKLKIYKILMLNTVGTWDCRENDDIVILAEHSSNDKQMQSRLLSSKFKHIQGALYAPFMKNLLTSSLEIKLKNLINGTELSGNILNLRIRCSDNTQAQLDSITILFQTSNIS